LIIYKRLEFVLKGDKETKKGLKAIRSRGELILALPSSHSWPNETRFVEVKDPVCRELFDLSLQQVHYAGSCQRVGRCMRLAVSLQGHWVGGVVLGSTFPNIDVRDEILGMKIYVRDVASRGLRNPWSSGNRLYWDTLQTIVNHARTFVFPEFQGQGIGIRTHKALLSSGIRLWEMKYSQKVYALDTLCDQTDSGLFVKNGWTHAGQTRGYTADYGSQFTQARKSKTRINNAALRTGSRRWEVWVRILKPSLRPTPPKVGH
jgi:GNAT superfamily N-acetyltransferase